MADGDKFRDKITDLTKRAEKLSANVKALGKEYEPLLVEAEELDRDTKRADREIMNDTYGIFRWWWVVVVVIVLVVLYFIYI